MTCVDDARLAANLGVDHVGVVIGTHGASWDEVDTPTARDLFAVLPPRVTRVALTLSTDPDVAVGLAGALRPDVVHVVDMVEASTADDLRALRAALGDVRLMCTVAVRDAAGAVAHAERVAPCCDYLLLDTVHPVTGVTGASGETHDWSTSARIVDAVPTPVILAGGLGPENVRDAITTVWPWGVDSETRTSRADDRRRKDPDALARFVAEARDAR
jgi:phosphoribosylanthranilate isomerase